MGIDFYACTICGDTFPDCGDYVRCEECDSKFCSDDCANMNYSQYDADGNEIDCEHEDWDDDEPGRCCICTKNEANDNILFNALLRHYKITRDDAMKIWQTEKEDDGK